MASRQSAVRWVTKARFRDGCTVAEVTSAFAATVGTRGQIGELTVELWRNGQSGEFIHTSEWVSLECLHRGIEVIRSQWDEKMLALCAILDVQFLVVWFGVSTDIPSTFGLSSASTKKLLRVSESTMGSHIEMFPDRDSRRLSSSAGFYFNNPYSLASWTCQVPQPTQEVVTTVATHPTTSCAEVNPASSTKPIPTKMTLAVRVRVEGGVEIVARASRLFAPRPEPGSLLIVQTTKGTVCLGRCVSVARWTRRRSDQDRSRICRHVNYYDMVHYQANVVPLGEKAYMVAARYLDEQRPRTLELVTAEAFLDLTGVVLRCRWVGEPTSSWGEEALVATLRSQLEYDALTIIVVGVTPAPRVFKRNF
jgi:hypothetical protein